MSYTVVLTTPARNDLLKITTYINESLFNAQAADAFLNEATEKIKALSDMPQKYAVVNDEMLKSLGIRMLRIKNYLVFYRIHEDKQVVTVLRIIHEKRDWQHILI